MDSVSESAGGVSDLRKARRRAAARPDAQTDRLPPHSPEAEQGVLGCALLSPNDCLDQLDEMGLQPESFYDLRHQEIYTVLRDMHTRTPRVAVDVITVQQQLKEAGLLEQIGGIPYLNALQDSVPSAANISYYAAIVREKWQLRTLIQICSETVANVFEYEGEVEQLLADVQKGFLRIEQQVMPAMEQRIKTVIKERVIPDLEEHYTRGRAQIRGITTGLEYLDKVLCGMGGKHGNYIVIAARPNTGKTSLATQIARHVALEYARWETLPAGITEPADVEQLERRTLEDGAVQVKRIGLPVAISSLEMSADTLVSKMLFQGGQADLQRWRTGFAQDRDVQLLTVAAGQFCKADNIIVDDTPRLRIGQLKAKWRRWHRQYGVRVFILDYLQLMQSDTKRFRPDRVQELAEVSAELQALGKELNCPMIVLAQMNRDYEKDPSRAPRLSDLKDCGAVEQDADVVGFLYEPRLSDRAREFYEHAMSQFYEKKMREQHGENWKEKVNPKWVTWDGRPQRINVLIAKNRFGPKGKAELLLEHTSTVFKDWVGWLKENKIKAPAKGEESRYRDGDQEEDAD